MVIYSITNTLDNKRYIGRAKKHSRRWSRHRYELRRSIHTNLHLQRAWNKHGEGNFLFEVIEHCLSEEQTWDRECHWISHYQSTDPDKGYNQSPGGKGSAASPEGRAKISARHKGKPLSPQHRQRIGDGNRGKTISSECRERLSKALLQRYAEGLIAVVPPPKPGALHPMWGKTHSEEVKAKLSVSSSRSYVERMGSEGATKVIERKRESFLGAANPFYKPFDIDYVKREIDKGILTATIAATLKISPPTLYKRFRGTYGTTIDAYKRQTLGYGHIDMEAVRVRLESGELLRDIALDIGVTYKTLSTRFKTTYGTLPKQYMADWRRRNRASRDS